ncbi:MAG TPA: ABC transporter ATP-binding protein [Pirellulaceae bacterium]|nr:ABC transporter ATP-binding protein [Pirellulaceae bacterium]
MNVASHNAAPTAAPADSLKKSEPLLEIQGLRTWFDTDEGVVKAVEDVSFEIPRGKTVGLVGESGSGKSVTAMSVIRLVSHPGRIAGGKILWHDRDASGKSRVVDLAQLSEREMQKFRGARIGTIFQEPMTSLNPVFTIGDQVSEAVRLHEKVSKREARDRAVDMLRRVRIPEPERRMSGYPHQFSGGMRQRVMIAMALVCRPQLLIADEPTTALDVTIQAQILDLLRELQQELGMSILIITHDLGVVAETADEVAVMYASRIVERANVRELFRDPRHPYTQGLFRSRPRPGEGRGERLYAIPGTVPSPKNLPPGCNFSTRCPYVQERCRAEEPYLIPLQSGRTSRCWFADTLDAAPPRSNPKSAEPPRGTNS